MNSVFMLVGMFVVKKFSGKFSISIVLFDSGISRYISIVII